MKTHELADSLMILARILKSSPSVEVSDTMPIELTRQEQYVAPDLSINLHSLAMLSKVDKKQWIQLISENKYPIEVRPRDASRDILGKLLRYLDENPDAIEKLRVNIDQKGSRTSEALDRALRLLLPEKNR
ncbi:hypothetical protein K7W42_07590 [Deinococcus sp. HMF7604]|uniref:hypothetical protein n=1 Tax=Deinococcus betulae TaxID=2873312 RepID=UPI001CCAFBAC|nr:hypothetical protein [Deinococcus betulae]MBZ9750721.1 hypothetical protein [Deinococcus betulae]